MLVKFCLGSATMFWVHRDRCLDQNSLGLTSSGTLICTLNSKNHDMLHAIETTEEAFEAFESLRDALKPRKNDKVISLPKRFEDGMFTWYPREEFFAKLYEVEGRFYCAYGVDNPLEVGHAAPTVEICPRSGPTDFRVAGSFAKNAGLTHLCHNGGIGGPRPGINKTNFWRYFRRDEGGDIEVLNCRGRKVPVVDLGPITHPDLRDRLARFVREVIRVREECEKPQQVIPDESGVEIPRDPIFKSEFSGMRRAYELNRDVTQTVAHGTVVDELRAILIDRGKRTANDRARDLYTFEDKESRSKLTALFEVKTSSEHASIYKAIGQLLFNLNNVHPGHRVRNVKLVMVIPGEPDDLTADTLRKIGIEVVHYVWDQNGKPRFNNSIPQCVLE